MLAVVRMVAMAVGGDAFQKHMVDPSYHPGLLRDNLHASVCTSPVTQEMLIGHGVFAIGEPFPLTPLYIF